MNGTWMLNLYPAGWRNRYEPEFRALLEAQSVNLLDVLDIAFGAIDAHLRPQAPRPSVAPIGSGAPAPPIRPQRDPVAAAHRRITWLKLFYGHAALFALVSLVVIAVNLLTAPAQPWFLFVLWGWGMPLALHAGLTFRWRDLFGAHLATFLVLNAGLAAINWVNGGSAWFLWVLWSLGILLVAHGLMAFGVTGLFGAHVAATVLAAVELLVVAAISSEDAVEMLWIIATLAVPLLAHALLRANRVDLYRTHVVIFAVMNALFFVQNMTMDRDTFWFQYPLVAWSLLLAAHSLVRFRLVDVPDSSWERAMIAELAARRDDALDASPEDRTLARRARLRLGLLLHVLFYVTGSIDLTLINFFSTRDTIWAFWPIGAWAVALAFHAGYVLIQLRLFGAHLVGGAAALGLIAIDRATPGGPWAYWPIGGLVLTLLLHAPFAFNVQRAVKAWERKQISDMVK